MVALLQALDQPRVGYVEIANLRAPLSRRNDDSRRGVTQSHAGLTFVPMLSAGAGGLEKLHLAFSFEGLSIGRKGRIFVAHILYRYRVAATALFFAVVVFGLLALDAFLTTCSRNTNGRASSRLVTK